MRYVNVGLWEFMVRNYKLDEIKYKSMFLTFLIKLVGFLVCRDNGNTGLSVSDQLVYQLKWLGRVGEWLGEP